MGGDCRLSPHPALPMGRAEAGTDAEPVDPAQGENDMTEKQRTDLLEMLPRLSDNVRLLGSKQPPVREFAAVERAVQRLAEAVYYAQPA